MLVSEVRVGEGVAQQERGAALLLDQFVETGGLEQLPLVGSPAAGGRSRLPLGNPAADDDAGPGLRRPGDPLFVFPLQGRVGDLEHVERAPLEEGRQVRQGRRHADPAHLALLPHILQHPDQIACLALLHRGIVVLHQVHVIRAQPPQAFVQSPESVFPRPDVLPAPGSASALGGQVELGAASREMPADLLFGRPRPVHAVVVGGIQEIDPRVQYRVQQDVPALVVEAAAQRGAEPEAGDLQAGAPELRGWNGWCHVVSSSQPAGFRV